MNEFTPTQIRMLEILSDGLPHTKDELHKCCGPSGLWAVPNHVSSLRKKLNRRGQDIVCRKVQNGPMCYQHVRLLSSFDE